MTDTRIPSETIAQARTCVDSGQHYFLVVLPFGTDIPGAQHDDGVTAISAGDLIDWWES